MADDKSEKFIKAQQEIREVRSLILDFINSFFPRSMSQALLEETMLDLPDPVLVDLVQRDLGYLKVRGLVESEDVVHPVKKSKERRWKLTAKGVTFIEREKPWAEIERLD